MNDLILQNNTKDNMHLTLIENKQKSFLDTTIGHAINKAINYGLKKILPDFIEDSVIEVKDALFQDGLINGIKTAITNVTDLGKSAIGTITGAFNKISQMEASVTKGGIIDTTSKLIDNQIKDIEKNNILPKEVTKIIKEGKNVIKNDMKQNIKNELSEQKGLLSNIKKYTEKWEKSYEENNFEKMEEYYNKIIELKDKTIPIDEINNEISRIDNINTLVKNKNSFNLSKLELELANKL